MSRNPTFIGTVQDVNGASVTIKLSDETVTGLTFVNGEGYRIGQVGSFVKIPLGLVSLFGIVSQVGAGAAPLNELEIHPHGNRWLSIQLVGEGLHNGTFSRGISQYPTIDDRVHIVTEIDLQAIYGPGDPNDFVPVGCLASAESIPAYVDINKLITRHSAIVGSSGSGKSTTVAGLLNALSDFQLYPSARIIVLDLHGEYANALKDKCTVFRVSNPNTENGEKLLALPFWALAFDELSAISFGNLDDRQKASVADFILNLKKESLVNNDIAGINLEIITVDSPIPFSLHKVWFELYKKEHQTVKRSPGKPQDELEPAYAEDQDGKLLEGDADTITPPQYQSVKTSGKHEEQINYGKDILNIHTQLAGLASKLRDPRFSFLFKPGKFSPNQAGVVKNDLNVLLEEWMGGPQPITILDLSGIPKSILNELIGALLRILYDALFWARDLPEGGRQRPLLLVLEEAHNYVNKDNNNMAANVVKRIAKEGRKYGVGLMAVSQRPSEIDPTILSQCGTIFTMRLTNDIDRGIVTSTASDNLKGLFDMLPILRTGEAIIVGEAVSLPIRTLIKAPPKDRRPDSEDPQVVAKGDLSKGFDRPGGWNQKRDPQDYSAVVRQWRTQDSSYEHSKNSSTNINSETGDTK